MTFIIRSKIMKFTTFSINFSLFIWLFNVLQYDYANAKTGKRSISISIVNEIKKMDGRFLDQNEDGSWFDIGDEKAILKTSQALRENQSVLRRRSSFPPRQFTITSVLGNMENSSLEDMELDNFCDTVISFDSPIYKRQSIMLHKNHVSNEASRLHSSINSSISQMSESIDMRRASGFSFASGVDLSDLGSIDDSFFGLRSSLKKNNSDADTNDTRMDDIELAEALKSLVAKFSEEENSENITVPSTSSTSSTLITTKDAKPRRGSRKKRMRRSFLSAKRFFSTIKSSSSGKT